MTNQDKKASSQGFRRKLKKFTESVKLMRGMNKIPRSPQKLKSSASDREKEAHAKKYALIPDKSTIMFFCEQLDGGSQRHTSRKPESASEETSDIPTQKPQLL
jgi:hypothetical protein